MTGEKNFQAQFFFFYVILEAMNMGQFAKSSKFDVFLPSQFRFQGPKNNMYGKIKIFRFQKKKKLFFPQSWKIFSLSFFYGKKCLGPFQRPVGPKHENPEFFNPFGPLACYCTRARHKGPNAVKNSGFSYFASTGRQNGPGHFFPKKNYKGKFFQFFEKKSFFFF